MFLVIAAVATVDVGAVVIGRARAQAAADLAALAAVTPYPRLPPGQAGAGAAGASPAAPARNADVPPASGLGSPTERATMIAASNGGQVVTCSCGPLETTVAVSVRVPLIPFGTAVQVKGYARAVLREAVEPRPVAADRAERAIHLRLATMGRGGPRTAQ
jgi:hypothetical protein